MSVVQAPCVMQLQILCTLNIAGSSASHRLILTFVAPQMEAPGQFSKLPWRSWVELVSEERKENKIEREIDWKHAKMVMTRWENLTAKLLLQLQEMEDEEERREKVVAKHAEARRRKAERIQREAEEKKAKAEEKKKKTKEKKAALSDKAIDITRELKKAAAEK